MLHTPESAKVMKNFSSVCMCVCILGAKNKNVYILLLNRCYIMALPSCKNGLKPYKQTRNITYIGMEYVAALYKIATYGAVHLMQIVLIYL